MHQSATESGGSPPPPSQRAAHFPTIKKTPNSLPVLKKYACVIEAFREEGFARGVRKKRLRKISLIEKYWENSGIAICTATVYKALHYLIEKKYIRIVTSEKLPNGFKSCLYELDEDKLEKVGYHVVSRGDWYKLLADEKKRLARLPLKPFENQIREAHLAISELEEKLSREKREIASRKRRAKKLEQALQEAKKNLQQFETDAYKFVSELDRLRKIE